jgi:hypothetical protein
MIENKTTHTILFNYLKSLEPENLNVIFDYINGKLKPISEESHSFKGCGFVTTVHPSTEWITTESGNKMLIGHFRMQSYMKAQVWKDKTIIPK